MRLIRLLAIFSCWALLLGGQPNANTAPVKTYESSFKEGEEFSLSPPLYVLTFQTPVLLEKIRLVNQDGEITSILPLSRPVKIQFVELPPLPPHGYRLFWEGKNGKSAVSGNIGFIVLGCGREQWVPPQPVD